MMRTINDAQKLKTNEKLFIGKPLKEVLKEIKPEIKMVFAEPNRSHGAASFFMFRFIDLEEEKKYNKVGKRPLSVTIFVKEKFHWDKTDLPRSDQLKWTNSDKRKYQNLTVAYIRVYEGI